MATTAISVREYLATSWSPDRELVDGEVLERALGEKEHSAIQRMLVLWFGNRRDQLGVDVWPELRVQVSTERFRVPDVGVTRVDDHFERYIQRPPVLCVEILSPEDRLASVREKVEDYVAMGVHDIWVIDPESRRCYTCIAGKFEDFTGDTLRIEGTEIHVPLAVLWAELDRLKHDRR
jgi:Uma2 family endonuclease